MWCQHCQNDVPIVVSDDSGKPTCAHCRMAIEVSQSGNKPKLKPHWNVDDVRSDIREIEGIIGGWTKSGAQSDMPAPPRLVSPPTEPPKLPPLKASLFIWSILLVGLLALSFGGALSVWALVGSQPRLWAVGLPMIVLGQSILIMAGLMQFERLQSSQRVLQDAIDKANRELSELRHTSNQMMLSQSGSAQSFYRHLANQASPHLLMADLKGQMDLLSDSLHRHDAPPQ